MVTSSPPLLLRVLVVPLASSAHRPIASPRPFLLYPIIMSLFLPPPTLCHPPSRILIIRSPRSCTPSTPPSETSHKPHRVRLPIPNPDQVPPLIRKPESVLAATATGLFLLAATAWRSARAALASIAARSFMANELWRMRERMLSREKEREFLESAVVATEANLENTKAFLGAQKRRMRVAEERLDIIAEGRRELEKAVGEVREREVQIKRLDGQLEEERKRLGNGKGHLENMTKRVETMKEDLRLFERKVGDEERRLEVEERLVMHSLEEVGGEVGRLETLLVENEEKLEREIQERDSFRETHREAEKELGRVGLEFESTLKDLEERRKKIEGIEEQAKKIRKRSKKKEADLKAAVENGASDQEIATSLERIHVEQESIRKSLEKIEERQMEKISERETLSQLIALRDVQLENMKRELDQFDKSKKEARAASANPFIVTAGERVMTKGLTSNVIGQKTVSDSSGSTDIQLDESNFAMDPEGFMCPDVDIEPSDIELPGVTSESLLSSAVKADNLQRVSIQEEGSDEEPETNGTRTPVVDLSSNPQPKKRRRGRPRKTPVSSETEMKSKRGRGRPKKVVSDGDVTSELTVPKKRGRPRKMTVTPIVSKHIE